MKILFANKFFYPRGGTETYMFSLASLLTKNNHKIIGFSQKNKNNKEIVGSQFFIDEVKLDKLYFKNFAKRASVGKTAFPCEGFHGVFFQKSHLD